MHPYPYPEHKLINGMSYLSILFFPFGFPLLVMIIGAIAGMPRDIITTAAKALGLHLVPVIALIIFALTTGVATTFSSADPRQLSGVTLILLAILVIVCVITYLYTLYRAIRIFMS